MSFGVHNKLITGDISEISFLVIGETVAIPYECVMEKKKLEKRVNVLILFVNRKDKDFKSSF